MKTLKNVSVVIALVLSTHALASMKGGVQLPIRQTSNGAIFTQRTDLEVLEDLITLEASYDNTSMGSIWQGPKQSIYPNLPEIIFFSVEKYNGIAVRMGLEEGKKRCAEKAEVTGLHTEVASWEQFMLVSLMMGRPHNLERANGFRPEIFDDFRLGRFWTSSNAEIQVDIDRKTLKTTTYTFSGETGKFEIAGPHETHFVICASIL